MVSGLLALGVIAAATLDAAAAGRFVPNEIIVKFRTATPNTDGSIIDLDGTTSNPLSAPRHRFHVREANRQADGRGQRRSGRWRGQSMQTATTTDLDRIYRVKVDTGAGVAVEQVLAAYLSRADVEYAELNPVIAICATPDDPAYGFQWSLPRIHAAEAWDTCRGSNEVVVAIIDTGVDYNHRDLQGNLWVNEAELSGETGVDDDGNGYIDDLHGYNFADDTSDPMDDHGHGTHCAGIVAAVGDNGLDIAGICWSARVMGIKILDADGEGDAADAVPAIYYAVASGADIISGSWGGEESSSVLKEAIAYAHRRGVLVVAAAGNLGSNAPYYPAAYPEVLSVAATDSSDEKWYLSNYGSWVDLAAPGYSIPSLRRGSTRSITATSVTARMSGTSMAAPHVSGACALLLSANLSLSCNELHDIVVATGDPIESGIAGSDKRLNLYEALRGAIPAAGTVRLDRERYADGSRVSILLADWDLRGAGSQEVSLGTDGGDDEVAVLTETEASLGVFTGEIFVHNAVVALGDGVLEAADGQTILVRYRDADDGLGNAAQWREASALADFSPPTVVDVKVEVHAVTATINLLTNEPALAEIRYGRIAAGPYDLIESEAESGELHTIDISGLSTQTKYYFVVGLTDGAGNETLANDAGQAYSFTTSGRAKALRLLGARR